MVTRTDYRIFRRGEWKLAIGPAGWSETLRQELLTVIEAQPRSKHPQTLPFAWVTTHGVQPCYVKVFHRAGGIAAIKDFCRQSKAFRFWRQGLALSKAGFNVPPTLAAGEHRRFRRLSRAFVVTAKIEGQALPAYLAQLEKAEDRRARVKEKRAGIARLAALIREFHRQGFVHGDLVASNLLITGSTDGHEPSIYFMDNDRTARFPGGLFPWLWKRNLIQLNRMPLPGISLQDRMRFLRVYLGTERLSGRNAKFARWLEQRTRRRRQECDGVNPTGSFRQLMRWDAGWLFGR